MANHAFILNGFEKFLATKKLFLFKQFIMSYSSIMKLMIIFHFNSELHI
jgi:hypothetical protein